MAIHKWRSEVYNKESQEYDNLIKHIDELDVKAELIPLNDEEHDLRKKWVARVAEIDHIKNLDLKQKARIKWAVEGDENSRFFHGVINGKRKKCRLNGLMIEGVWVKDPIKIKETVFEFSEKSLMRKFLSDLL